MTAWQISLTALLVVLASIHLSSAEVRIESGLLNGTIIPSAQFYKKGNCPFASVIDLTTYVGDDFTVFFIPISGYMALNNATDVEGKIVVLDEVPVQAIYRNFFDIQDRGAIGILYNANTRKFNMRIVSFDKFGYDLCPKCQK